MAAAAAFGRDQQGPASCDKEVDTSVQPPSAQTYPFPRVDDPPPDLKEILAKLIGKTEQLGGSDTSDEETRFRNKPWLSWPRTLRDVNRSETQRLLYGYLTNRVLLAQRTKQIRDQFHKFAAAEGLVSYEERADEFQRTAVLLEGGTSDDWNYYSSDCSKDVFRQDPFFRYLFGVNEPDLYGLLDLRRKETILFFPSLSAEVRTFFGEARTPEWYVQHYGLDGAVVYKDAAVSLNEEIEKRRIEKVFVLRGMNSDSGKEITPPAVALKLKAVVDDGPRLHTALCASRVYKVPLEIDFMRAACLVSSQAHIFVMENLRRGMIEVHAEGLFKAYVLHAGGSRQVGYTCVCCAGENAAILHYGHAGRPNDARIEAGDLLLLDMGGEYQGYSTDITMTFPIDGVFTEKQRVIYEAVYDAQRRIEKQMMPGVAWPELHRRAERIILGHLIRAGILRGTVRECAAAHLGSVFMPHGLGHFVGLDTHDVGGFLGARRSEEEGLRHLRTTRVLEEGMIITVEPGCYFIPWLLQGIIKNPMQNKYLNLEVLETYMGLGGVRLEDVVIVTTEGIINMTALPRRLTDVEEVLSRRELKESASAKEIAAN